MNSIGLPNDMPARDGSSILFLEKRGMTIAYRRRRTGEFRFDVSEPPRSIEVPADGCMRTAVLRRRLLP